MTKEIKMYSVDYGDTIRIMGEPTLKMVYETQIDHTEYADYDDWFADMTKCGLVTEVR